MKLFDRYRDFPPGLRGIGLDAEFDYDRRTDTFSDFEKCLRQFSSLVYKRYLSRFNINTGSEHLFLLNKQLPNILFKTILLEELVETRQEKIQIDCFDEELEFFDNENISRFASIFALIGRHIPDWCVVKNLGCFPNIAPSAKGSAPKNILLRISNIQSAVIIQKVLVKVTLEHG